MSSTPVLTDSQLKTEMKKIPVFMRGVPPKIIQYALKFGIVRMGWTVKDYLKFAVKSMGYCTILVWGEQGCGKSNRMLQHGFWIYGDWDKVLEHLVFEPLELVNRLKELEMGHRVPWIGWDDVGVHFPSASWRTDIQKYEAVDAAWAAIRTKCNTVTLTIPLIDRLAKNLKDNISIEEFIGPNQMIISERYVRLPGIKNEVGSNFRKVQIEPMRQFNLFDVPTDVFKEYWEDMRLPLAEQALERLSKVVEKGKRMEGDGKKVNPEDYISIIEGAEIIGTSARSFAQECYEVGIRKVRLNGLFHVKKEDFERIRKAREKARLNVK